MKSKTIPIRKYLEDSVEITGEAIRKIEWQTNSSLGSNSKKYIGRERLKELKYCWFRNRELGWTNKNDQKEWFAYSLCMLESGELFRVKREWLAYLWEACAREKVPTKEVLSQTAEEYINLFSPQDLTETARALELKTGDLSIASYNWLCGFDQEGYRYQQNQNNWFWNKIKTWVGLGGLSIGRLRAQAASAYPMLPFLMAEAQENADLSSFIDRNAINLAISEQKSLNDSLRDNLAMPNWGVRKLVGLKPKDFSLEYFQSELDTVIHSNRKETSLANVFFQASRLKPEFWPSSPQDWQGFIKFLTLAEELLGGLTEHNQLKIDFLNSIGTRWNELASKDWRLDHEDVTNDLTANLILPFSFLTFSCQDIQTDHARTIAKNILWSGKSISRVAETIELWHRREGDIRRKLFERFPIGNEAESWLALSEEFTASNGYQVVVLNTRTSLREDGEQLNHCVSRYSTDCIYGDSHILSIRDETGEKTSTCEVSDYSHNNEGVQLSQLRKNGLLVKQHRALNNAEPSKACKLALREWLRGVKEETITVDWQAIDQARRQSVLNNPSRWGRSRYSSNYLATSQEAVDAAWQEYSIFLNPHLKETGSKLFALELEKLASIS